MRVNTVSVDLKRASFRAWYLRLGQAGIFKNLTKRIFIEFTPKLEP